MQLRINLSVKECQCARDEWRTTYINTNNNVADLLMKPLAGPKQSKFVKCYSITTCDRRLGEEYDKFI